MSSESSFGVVSLSVMLLLALYAIGGAFMEAKHVYNNINHKLVSYVT
jgi:hypothetical protein